MYASGFHQLLVMMPLRADRSIRAASNVGFTLARGGKLSSSDNSNSYQRQAVLQTTV